ncbi:MAG: thiamine phosphate synthase [Clostridiaceae bacterium]
MNKNFDLRLYLITDSTGLDDNSFLRICEEALKGGVTMLQLREKYLSSGDFYKRAMELKKLTDKYNVPLIINDRVDIALAVKALGVHLGQDDLPINIARDILGPDAIIGCTAKTEEQGLRAKTDGADYIGSGAMYASGTKEDAKVTPIEVIDNIKRVSGLPVVAIGGLNKDNLEILRGSKVSGISLSGGIMKAFNPKIEAELLLNKVNDVLCY